MPTTRKKGTVYKDQYDDEDDNGDYSDSGSEAIISEESSSSEEVEEQTSSAEEFENKSIKSKTTKNYKKKPQFTKSFLRRIQKQTTSHEEEESAGLPILSVKDLTDEDKLLPPVLNLSESDSTDSDEPNTTKAKVPITLTKASQSNDSENENVSLPVYRDVWSQNIQDNSAEIAQQTFEQLEKHTHEIENTKATLAKYKYQNKNIESNVKDLLALGEEAILPSSSKTIYKSYKDKYDSESEIEDWEEVKAAKAIPQQGIQLFVEFPDGATRRCKQIDVEMMMRRKLNRVKKEYQVYMHKVHVLCWIAHGNYVSKILNDQEILSAALLLVPSKSCYPGERVDIKYVEQITTWFKEKFTFKQEKNEDKYKPKALPLKDILKVQMKNKVVTTKKYLVFIFVSMLRALGLQCRIMFNFVTLPLKPPTSELCSLSTKAKNDDEKKPRSGSAKQKKSQNPKRKKIDEKKKTKNEPSKIFQLDGNDDRYNERKPSKRNIKSLNKHYSETIRENENGISPPKQVKKNERASRKVQNSAKPVQKTNQGTRAETKTMRNSKEIGATIEIDNDKAFDHRSIEIDDKKSSTENSMTAKRTTRQSSKANDKHPITTKPRNRGGNDKNLLLKAAKSTVQNNNINDVEVNLSTSSKYFTTKESSKLDNTTNLEQKLIKNSNTKILRKRSQNSNPCVSDASKMRTKSIPGKPIETSKYFKHNESQKNSIGINQAKIKVETALKRKKPQKDVDNDKLRISHRDLLTKTTKKSKNDVKPVLVEIIKNRVKEAKTEAKRKLVKGKMNEESDNSDCLPEENIKLKKTDSDSDDDFKPTKISPKYTSRKLDRRVLSPDKEKIVFKNKTDVWCEIYVEELEQWISVDVVNAKVHCCNEIYNQVTHPVAYIVGWDNNNYLKDLTRRYVPQWNTVTRKLRAEPDWWNKALQPWLGPKTARDREEDEYLDKLQLEAPLPKSITEYKNHPLYALKRHLLKFEALYPPDAPTLGFVRGEAVYARDCVHVCRSRDIWLKEAKVVRLGEKPYKIVKARPKWDKLSNKIIKDRPLEIFGPWQVQDYEPPVAENGIVPRNAYGNVELFKDCMLPKGTVHLKLPGLNKVARKLNIDCAPAMTGFDFNGGWCHPVYDGFVVCKEFEELITDAWVKDQEEQERKEQEKFDLRVYGNWKRLIKGLLIRERLKIKYGFEEPSTSKDSKKKSKAPRLVIKKKN